MKCNITIAVLIIICTSLNINSEINLSSDDSYNLGIEITEGDINATINALSTANYLGFAAPGPVTGWITVNGFRIKIVSASIDLSTIDDLNVCDLNMNIDAKADAYWNNNLLQSIFGDFRVKATFNNVIMKVKLDIMASDDGEGFNLVAIPVGWDAGSVTVVSSTFKIILGIVAENMYNQLANPISHMYAGHILNKPIKLASLSVIYQKLPKDIMEKGSPTLSFGNDALFIGWKAKKTSSILPIIQYLLDE